MARFKYPLDSILKQYAWEVDALRVELMTLNQALHAKSIELQEVVSIVRDTEQQILELCRENAIIALDRKAMAELYLRHQRQLMHERQTEFDQAQKLANGVFDQLRKKRQSQRAIEKHRERTKLEFDAEGMRRESLDADDLWLAKIGASK